MSVVYYVPTDGDELLISTMGGRAKAKTVARSGKVSLCILDERWPFAYLLSTATPGWRRIPPS